MILYVDHLKNKGSWMHLDQIMWELFKDAVFQVVSFW